MTICMILSKNPLLNEPGVNIHNKDIDKYNTIIEYSNISIAICDMIKKTAQIYNNKFDMFYPAMKEHFNKNYNKILAFIINQKEKNQGETVYVSTTMYAMQVGINYDKLYTKFTKLNEAGMK